MVESNVEEPEIIESDSEDNDEVNNADGDDADLTEENRLQRTIFVGNVSEKASAKDVKKLFKTFGPIETVRIRNVFPGNPKIPKKVALLAERMSRFVDSHTAYVVFKDSHDISEVVKKACLERHFTNFKDRHIRVTPAVDNRTGPSRRTVFVGNVPFDCSEEEFITTFFDVAKSVGSNLLNIRLNRDLDTGVCRGTGFASFPDDVDVQAVLNMAGEIKIRNKVLRIFRAQKENNKLSKTHKRHKRTDRKMHKQNHFSARKSIQKNNS